MLQDILASLLNTNPGSGGLLSQGGYLTQTGLGPEQMARYRQGAGMPSAAPAQPRQAAPAPQTPDMMQTASTRPASGGIGDFLGGLLAPKATQKNRTVQLLMEDGLDEGTATLYAGNKNALTQYLLQRSQGTKPLEVNGRLVDPNTFQVLADFSTPGNRQTTTIDGKLVDTNTGQVIGDYGGEDNEFLERQAAATAFGLQQGTPEYQRFILTGDMPDNRDQDPAFKSEMELRKEYDTLPEVKDYKTVRSNFERIRQGVQLGTGAGDAAIVFGYMKMLDPTSVVREGEQATTRNAAGVPEAIRGMYNQLIGGGQLSGEARQQILSAAEKVYGESSANIEEVNKRYSGYAGDYRLDPNRIVAPVERYDPLQIAPNAPSPGRFAPEVNPATGKGSRLHSDPLGIR